MAQEKKEKQKYFEEALSDFTHDVASGRAIRHLVDLGYTTDQIMKELAYPTPRRRVEETVVRYMKDKGILRNDLPFLEEEFREIILKNATLAQMYREVRSRLEKNGEENSYIACPFGMIRRDREIRIEKMLSPLTGREKEYLMGIGWEIGMMYHRLTPRMLEIGVQLAVESETEFPFYFFRTKEKICCHSKQ